MKKIRFCIIIFYFFYLINFKNLNSNDLSTKIFNKNRDVIYTRFPIKLNPEICMACAQEIINSLKVSTNQQKMDFFLKVYENNYHEMLEEIINFKKLSFDHINSLISLLNELKKQNNLCRYIQDKVILDQPTIYIIDFFANLKDYRIKFLSKLYNNSPINFIYDLISFKRISEDQIIYLILILENLLNMNNYNIHFDFWLEEQEFCDIFYVESKFRTNQAINKSLFDIFKSSKKNYLFFDCSLHNF